MLPSARLFNCARCHCQVTICTRCDRGQRYCAQGCAALARTESCARASRLYQSSRAGRENNALRQARHRARQRQKVTHQGSALEDPSDLLAEALSTVQREAVSEPGPVIHCHFCRCQCDPFLRRRWLARGSRRIRQHPDHRRTSFDD